MVDQFVHQDVELVIESRDGRFCLHGSTTNKALRRPLSDVSMSNGIGKESRTNITAPHHYGFLHHVDPGRKDLRKPTVDSPSTGSPPKVQDPVYTHLQCAQVLEHYFHGRTEGKGELVAPHAQFLNKALKPEGEVGRLHDSSFEIWAEINKVPQAEVDEIDSNWANWTTLKTHEGVLLKLLLSTESNQKGFDLQNPPHSVVSYYASLLQQFIPNQDILPTSEPPSTPVARICEAFSRFGECKPPLRDGAGLWKEEAIEDWIKAWKVEKGVAQIL